jgi:hypothetical protein
MHVVMPKAIKGYFQFTEDLARTRVEVERRCEAKKHPVEREDMFFFLCTARGPITDDFALTKRGFDRRC